MSNHELDKWAAEFVGPELYFWLDPEQPEDCLCVTHDKREWRWSPSSPDAPLWQMGMVLEKLGTELNELIYCMGAMTIFQNPAAVLQSIREVVENGSN